MLYIGLTGLTGFSGSDRTRALIFVRFGKVDVFGKSLKRVVCFSFIFVFIIPTKHSGDHDGRISGNTTALNNLCTFWKSYRRFVRGDHNISGRHCVIFTDSQRIGVCYHGF